MLAMAGRFTEKFKSAKSRCIALSGGNGSLLEMRGSAFELLRTRDVKNAPSGRPEASLVS